MVFLSAMNEDNYEKYPFYTGSSELMKLHFKKYADWIKSEFLMSNSKLIEIGSNDGTFLSNFKNSSIEYVGFEPSENVAIKAKENNIKTINDFFNSQSIKILKNYANNTDVISASNVICHIPNLKNLILTIDELLSKKGLFIFEEPYMGSMFEKTSYDQIYDEHVYIFSARSVINIFSKHGFELINIKPQSTHGGSMRYILARKGKRAVSPSIKKQLNYEDKNNLHIRSTYDLFREKCELSRKDLVSILQQQKNDGRRVVGYAATSKSTTVLNYCGIGPDLINFISDTTPIKQGKYSPGVHIPVLPYEELQNGYPDTLLLFAWNHKTEIMEKESSFLEKGGEWIIYVPDVTLIRK